MIAVRVLRLHFQKLLVRRSVLVPVPFLAQKFPGPDTFALYFRCSAFSRLADTLLALAEPRRLAPACPVPPTGPTFGPLSFSSSFTRRWLGPQCTQHWLHLVVTSNPPALQFNVVLISLSVQLRLSRPAADGLLPVFLIRTSPPRVSSSFHPFSSRQPPAPPVFHRPRWTHAVAAHSDKSSGVHLLG